MPTNCCVPLSTKKGYRDENGDKVSFFKFADEENRRKKWIHAIRRDIGEHFEIKDTTKVCSRHFRNSDFVKTLGGRRGLRADAVPSVFQWTRTSPRKRKPPAQRETVGETSRVIFQEPEPQEEPNYTGNLLDEEACVTCENVQSDAETQTEMIPDDIETALRQQLADLKSELEKAHRRIEALQTHMTGRKMRAL